MYFYLFIFLNPKAFDRGGFGVLGRVPAKLLRLFTVSIRLFVDLRHESSVFCKTCAAEKKESSRAWTYVKSGDFMSEEERYFLGN